MPDRENGTKILFSQKKNIFPKLLEDLKFTNNRYIIDACVYTKKRPLSSFDNEKNSKKHEILSMSGITLKLKK